MQRFSQIAPLAAFAALLCGCHLVPGDSRTVRSLDQVTADLSAMIEAEMADKEIGAVSIALIDDQETAWITGFGLASTDPEIVASGQTVYRIGSVSKLFTDIAVMQLVEAGRLDLDRPVTDYLPGFAPGNPFDAAITLRQLMAHRSGLVREPPVGNYFDASEPSLAATVTSLNETRLVYPPGSRIKYSNAGIAVVGRVVEAVTGEPFARALEQRVLLPMGLSESAFAPRADLIERLAEATMWSYDGRTFPAPGFELGMAPAGCMYSTVADLARFVSRLLAIGSPVDPAAESAVLKRTSLEEMFTPQFAPTGARSGYGLGFRVGELDGRRLLGHGGAIYGFATNLAFLPDDRLGVVVTSNVDVSNSVVTRIAERALTLLLARKQGGTVLPHRPSGPLRPGEARRLEGEYLAGPSRIELHERNGRLFLDSGRRIGQIRRQGRRLIVDDRLAHGTEIEPLAPGRIRIGGTTYRRVPVRPKPAPPPQRFGGLIGEYGPDHNILFVFEKHGVLTALIEWIEIDPLTELLPDQFALPRRGGMYHGEEIAFERDETGRASAAIVAGIRFERRTLQGETAGTFRIRPIRPIDELRAEALAATPPAEDGEFFPSDLVQVESVEPELRLDIRYATTNNFMSERFYSQARAFLQRPAAEAVARAHRSLRKHGYGLLIHDGYRPWYVTKMFYDGSPAEMKPFVAVPSQGSRHNRGCAVDLTLYELATGKPVQMVGLYDEGSPRSYPDYPGGTSLQRWHRELLRDAMEAQGFSVFDLEWWHFDFQGWHNYRIENLTFEELGEPAAVPAGSQ